METLDRNDLAMPEITLNPDQTTLDDILERARALLPVLRKRATSTERLRRLPDDTHRDFIEAGFYRIMQPRAFGGLELPFGSQTALGTELARACGSSSWVATLFACHAWILGMFDPQAQAEVWDEQPGALVASSFLCQKSQITRVTGGIRLTGQWRYSSGVDHAHWLIVLAAFDDPLLDGRRAFHYLLMPMRDVRVEDTWYSTGMAGTGSNDVFMDDVFIPEHRMLEAVGLRGGPTPGSAVNPGYLYSQPLFGTFSFNLVGNVIGLARGAAEVVIEALTARTSITGATISAQQSIQLRVADALSGINAAQALVFRNRDEIIADGLAGRIADLPTRARYRGDNGFATRLCVDAVDQLVPALGARGLEAGHPLQRIWRDIHTVSQHIALTWDVQGSIYGAVALGYPCPDPRV